MSTPAWAHAALSHPVSTGLSRQHLAELAVELAEPWTAAHESALEQRRGHHASAPPAPVRTTA